MSSFLQRHIIRTPGYGIEALRLFEAMTVKPSGQRKRLISDTIKQLQRAQLWELDDALWITAAHDSQAGRLNWKNPGNFTLTAVNSPTFTGDRGFTGNGTSSYLDTNFNPSTAGVKFTQNSAGLSAYMLNSLAALAQSLIGHSTAASYNHLYPRFSDGVYYSRVNDGALPAGGAANGSTVGMYAAGRFSTTGRDVYKNGASFTSLGAFTSAALINSNILILADNVAGVPGAFSQALVGMASVGGYKTAAQQLVYFNIINGYLNRLGAT